MDGSSEDFFVVCKKPTNFSKEQIYDRTPRSNSGQRKHSIHMAINATWPEHNGQFSPWYSGLPSQLTAGGFPQNDGILEKVVPFWIGIFLVSNTLDL